MSAGTDGEDVLLVDTGFAARPIYDWLVARGYRVWVMGRRPDDALAKTAGDRYLQEDYSDVAKVQAHVDRLGVRYVVPGCTDVSLETCLRLRVPGTVMDPPEVYAKLGDKAAFRQLCQRLDLPSPRRLDLDDLPRGGRVIAKPVDSFSGRGITIFDGTDLSAARAALSRAEAQSASGRALFETFAEGELYSFTAFVEAGTCQQHFVVHEACAANPFAVDVSAVDRALPATAETGLRRSVECLSQELRLVDGLIHVQFILDDAGPQIIEISRRCPGDLYSLLVRYSTGFDYAGKYASQFVDARYETEEGRPRHVLRHTVTVQQDIFTGFAPPAPGRLLDYYPLAALGHRPAHDEVERVGLVFMEYDDPQALDTGYRRLRAWAGGARTDPSPAQPSAASLPA